MENLTISLFNMATEVRTLSGEDIGNQPRKIKFIQVLNEDSVFISDSNTYKYKPEEFDHIIFLRSGLGKNKEYDLMYAYNANPNAGKLFVGFFNNGIV